MGKVYKSTGGISARIESSVEGPRESHSEEEAKERKQEKKGSSLGHFFGLGDNSDRGSLDERFERDRDRGLEEVEPWV